MKDFSSYYEEIQKFQNIKNDEEINKYFIDYNLSEKEKIDFILKEGYYCQKQCV